MSNPQPSYSPVVTLPANRAGRDFIIGDIHGAYDLLDDALATVEFNPDADRLFSTGDLVDRGPDSESALRYLGSPWFHAVRGNHEQMFLDFYASPRAKPQDLEDFCQYNGRQWWADTSPAFRSAFLDAIDTLPYILETRIGQSTIGILHAEPLDAQWQTLKKLISVETEGAWARQHILWSRNNLRQNISFHVDGIDRIYVGHNPVCRPTQMSNVLYVDTGAAGAQQRQDPTYGQLTLIELSEHGNQAPAPTNNPFVSIMRAAPADVAQYA